MYRLILELAIPWCIYRIHYVMNCKGGILRGSGSPKTESLRASLLRKESRQSSLFFTKKKKNSITFESLFSHNMKNTSNLSHSLKKAK